MTSSENLHSAAEEAKLLAQHIDELYRAAEQRRGGNHHQLVRRLLTEAEGCVELAARLMDR